MYLVLISAKMYDLEWPVREIQVFFVADLREITLARKRGRVSCHKSIRLKYEQLLAHSVLIEFTAASRGFPATARLSCCYVSRKYIV